jgi:hypothetical protein
VRPYKNRIFKYEEYIQIKIPLILSKLLFGCWFEVVLRVDFFCGNVDNGKSICPHL